MTIVALIKDNFNKNLINKLKTNLNKTLLRLFLHHCDRNLTEMFQSLMKKHLKYFSHNNNIKILIEEGTERITAQDYSNFARHVRESKKDIGQLRIVDIDFKVLINLESFLIFIVLTTMDHCRTIYPTLHRYIFIIYFVIRSYLFFILFKFFLFKWYVLIYLF